MPKTSPWSSCRRDAEVGQTQGGDGMVADLGQSLPALGVGSQDLRGLAEPVQAVEPLADQPRALEGRPLGEQRLTQAIRALCSAFWVSPSVGRRTFGLQAQFKFDRVFPCSISSLWSWSRYVQAAMVEPMARRPSGRRP